MVAILSNATGMPYAPQGPDLTRLALFRDSCCTISTNTFRVSAELVTSLKNAMPQVPVIPPTFRLLVLRSKRPDSCLDSCQESRWSAVNTPGEPFLSLISCKAVLELNQATSLPRVGSRLANALALPESRISAPSILPKNSISFATRPVQPVWWLAPRPAPLSPWKYS